MAELKTKPTGQSVESFIDGIENEGRREDCRAIAKMMSEATGAEPKMWGPSIVGFGDYRYKSPTTRREGDWFLVGFSPRKANLTLYLITGFEGKEELLESLGKHTTGGGCLYIKRLDDVHLPTLKKLIKGSVKATKALSKSK